MPSRTPFAVAAVLLGAAAAAAPVPKELKGGGVYFPITVGAKWVYETPNGELETAVVAAVEKDGNEWTVTRQGADGTRTAYSKVVVSADGLRQERELTDGKLGWLLKTNVKAGESWAMPEGGQRSVFGPERVEVPAGKFLALRVVWEQAGGTFTSWYAPGVGEVKRVRKVNDTETVSRLLKSFQPK